MNLYKENSNAIGGFFQLQLPVREEYYPSLIKLNTSRNALEYILKVKQYTKIYIPYFTCSVLLEPILKLGVAYEFYSINSELDPIIDFEIGPTECFLYTNYFGLKSSTINSLCKTIQNIVIDNAQAFFSEPISGVDTIYSCRKFFGVSDGAYLYLNINTRLDLETDVSVERFTHLIKSMDIGKEEAFGIYQENEKRLENQDIKQMSVLTQKILSGIDYQSCKNTRNENFSFLHESLAELNELNIEMPVPNGPLVYPFLVNNEDVRNKLIEKKIFTPTYWPNVFEWTNNQMIENYLAKYLVLLPIDHRYNLNDMKLIVKSLKEVLLLSNKYLC
ncbi:hypothetical protein [Pedobacter sp. B4-66]|uniref:hypothetical protein n=1 Tax=Pedobacter sp. B4-66 TaxID=2817280 RepID=UPI001BD9E99F|nr:hypothetical protein [Pedobacter sp. B4-66]